LSDNRASPTKSPLDYTTATAANALSPAALNDFLDCRHDGRLATIRDDGWPHLTPIWFLWQEPVLYFSLGVSRLHLANLRRDTRATFCVGEDLERDGSGGGTTAAVAFGRAAITALEDDEPFVRAMTEAVLGRYRPTDESIVWAEDRAIVTLAPDRWLTWASPPTAPER
jgi:PPOX class probable F420-dependent enzyme